MSRLRFLSFFFLLFLLLLSGYALAAEQEEQKFPSASQEERQALRIRIQVADRSFTAELEKNAAADRLAQMLSEGPLRLPASNYGGFEKILELGTGLPRSDRHIRTVPGDIMLYAGDCLVIFYGSNAWSYTPIGRIVDFSQQDLEKALSGSDAHITLSRE